ncbi:galactokinase [Microbacterium paludicola]|uniref:Galactokinase n=1 Tax=Microbacterium paludicola TaxID=300019 RepID=A0A4Y9FTL9_9MICO|nr:galactokinase [Microbacterium paludicola]MBF0816647.1 galactokinase [Microbacterium paludicola]TFU32629.1 galactokinase [Microbacterium paludicola]
MRFTEPAGWVEVTALNDAEALFTSLTGRGAEGVWSSAGRANLIGEHTDYNEGFVLPFAIQHRTYAAAGMHADLAIRVASTFSPDPVEVALAELETLFAGAPGAAVADGTVPEWAAYPLGVAWAALAASGRSAADVPGVDIAIASDVPVGAGLSSSAAIEGAVAAALNDLWQLGLSPLDMAKVGRRAENEAVGAPTGIMDQVSSILGRADAATFLDCRTLETRSVDLGLEREGLILLAIDTKVEHAHASGGYRDRRAACERGAAALGVPSLRDLTEADLDRARDILDDVTFRRVRHIVTENQRVLDTVDALASGGPRAIGDLLVASHASMRDDFEISVPELDTAVDAALAAGAIGARMTGGGFGGSAVALVEADAVDAVADAAARAFAARGYAAPHAFTVVPSEGVRRDA